MGYGKYSPHLPNCNKDDSFFRFNCLGQEPEEWTAQDAENFRNRVPGAKEFNTITMMSGYDSEGYDRYGYSDFVNDCTLPEGKRWVGSGSGVDRAGMTEYDYLLEHNNEELYE